MLVSICGYLGSYSSHWISDQWKSRKGLGTCSVDPCMRWVGFLSSFHHVYWSALHWLCGSGGAQLIWRDLYVNAQPGSHFKDHFSHHTQCPVPREIHSTVTSGFELLLQPGRALTYPISYSPALCRRSPALRQLRWTTEQRPCSHSTTDCGFWCGGYRKRSCGPLCSGLDDFYLLGLKT